MLDTIIRFSIRNKLIVGIFTIALVIWGVYSLTRLPIDAVPDITNNQVQILTVSPSNGAEDIERFVTFPVEQMMATIPEIEEVRSFSRFGLSVVTIVFKEHVDIYWARQQVSERLNQSKEQIPKGMGTPELAPLTTGLGEIFQYVIHTKPGYEHRYDGAELRTIQDWIVRRQLLGTHGVADVSSFGGRLKQYEISLDPAQLRNFGIGIGEVTDVLNKNNQNTGGAYIDQKPNAYFIRTSGLLTSIADIEHTVVRKTPGGIPVLIKDLGHVKYGSAVRYGAMTRNDEGEVVGGIVMMLKGENSSLVIRNVKERIAQIEKTLPQGVVIEPFLDRTRLVNNAVKTVSTNLIEGALIVIFVLVLMLGNIRAGFIVASVIPLAMLFAVSMMHMFGVSGNLMSLGAIDFGLIVDGAVIIVEATLHHLRSLTTTTLSRQDMDREVFYSSSRIRKSAAFGELIILIVYLPILALTGIEGKMFKPMAQTVGFAIAGAFILSLTYVPMMSALFLNKGLHRKSFSDKIMAWLQMKYIPALQFAMHRKKLVAITVTLAFIGSVFLLMNMGGEFIPTLEEGDFAVETRVMTGSSLSETIDAAQRSARILKDNFPEVKEVVGKIGSSEIPTDPMPVEACDLMVILKDKDEWVSAKSRTELAEKMEKKLKENTVGITYGFQQPIQMRFNELMTGARQDVVVKVYGEDLQKLSTYAEKIGKLASTIEGAEDLYVEQNSGLPQLVVNYKKDQVALYGLHIEDINTTIRSSFAGEIAGQVFEGEKRFDLVVRLDSSSRKNVEDLREQFITTSDGSQIPLGQLADISIQNGPYQIQRDDAKRRIIIGFNIRNNDIRTVVKQLEQKINDEISFEPGYYVSYGGTFKTLEEATNRLMIAVPASLLLILVLLYLTFNSGWQALLIFTAIPLSAIGGIAALWIRDMPFSISAGIGFIALFGVAVLNGIVLLSEFNHIKKEGLYNVDQTIIKGAANRLRPVIITAMVASLGFLPMAISGGSGAEVQRPLATVVIGGLISATVLTLFVLPVLYMIMETKIQKRQRKGMIIPAILLCLSAPCGVQAQSTPRLLTMNEAVTIALEKSPATAAASTQIVYRKAQSAASVEIPKTDFTYMQGQYNSYEKKDNSITVSQSIPFPTYFIARHNLAKNLIHAEELNLEYTKGSVALEVKTIYSKLQFLHGQYLLLLRTDSLLRGISAAMATLHQTGENSLLEKSAADLQMMEVRNQLQQNKTERASVLMQLKLMLGSTEDVDLKDSTLTPVTFPWNDSLTEIHNPMLDYMKQQIVIADLQKKTDVSRALPDLKLGYFNQTLAGAIDPVNNSLATLDSRFQGFIIGASIPIWFTPSTARIKAGTLQKKLSQDQYESYRLQLQRHYTELITIYKHARQNLEYYTNYALPNAILMESLAEKSYKAGNISYSELLQALKNVTSIRQAHLRTISEYNQTIYQLQFISFNN